MSNRRMLLLIKHPFPATVSQHHFGLRHSNLFWTSGIARSPDGRTQISEGFLWVAHVRTSVAMPVDSLQVPVVHKVGK